ncbi:peptidase S8/S53 domain-containing protein [Gilbertella persicaria]|uniref:peptidase S8/S53 domain-containing protein n=1 Tax=Gilbertella persicaria TaxID=101096 RepID=UPI0022200D1C|nr:peptidase S8/S53 domain-containing protein [Gilbertella persicaria]KAI8079682.1 peptidase S8/S53 domain-containing protein [Gilbertella persicaria]
MAVFVITAEAAKINHPKLARSTKDTIPGRYIVRFTESKIAADRLFGSSLIKDITNDDDIQIKQKFNHRLFSGVTINMNHGNEQQEDAVLQKILDNPDVKKVYPVRVIPLPKTTFKKSGSKDDNVNAPSILPHGVTQVNLVHSVLKNKGKGILVGVLDSGIDYKHPAFGGGFGEGYKVSVGYDLVGNDFNGYNTPNPSTDPLDDCGANSGANGHGTHVSGIIAGYDKSKNFTGVAPEANLGMWRVFGCTGITSTDIVVKALLMAYDAGVDVINMSIVLENPWDNPDNAEIEVSNQLAAKGVTIVIAGGNNGGDGLQSINTPGTAPNAITAASINNNYHYAPYIEATGVGAIEYSASDELPASSTLVLGTRNISSDAQACTADDVPGDVKGKLALIQRDDACAVKTKTENAAAAGAVGVVFYDQYDDNISDFPPYLPTIPSLVVGKRDGQKLIAAVKAGTVDVTVYSKEGLIPTSTGGTVSDFSSRGPTAELEFKPNIAATGGQVYSTLPRYLDSYGFMSGTSMATPYIAGSVALYLHAHENKKGAVKYIREQFQNYALPVSVSHSGTIDSPVRQGAGLVQVYDAITQNIHVSPSQISFNDTANTKYRTQTITVTNNGPNTIQFQVVNDVATGIAPYDYDETGYKYLMPEKDANVTASLRFSKKTFKLASGQSQDITVTVTPPTKEAKNHIAYGGFIRFRSLQQEKNVDLKVPYIGINAKQSDLPILGEGSPSFVGTDSKPLLFDHAYEFNLTSDRWNLEYTIINPTRLIKGEVLDAKTEKVLGRFQPSLEYKRPNSYGDDQAYSYLLLGTYIPVDSTEDVYVDLPEGSYKLRLSAQKMFSDPNSKDGWYTWTIGPVKAYK